MRFTREDFDTMVTELLYSEKVSYDALYRITEVTLRKKVVYWCSAESCLRGKGYEDDIMQEIHLRVIKTVIPNFLLNGRTEGPYNNNPEGFSGWLCRVGKNIKEDFAGKLRRIDANTQSLEDPSIYGAPDSNAEDAAERIERLMQALSIVLSAEVGIYKTLTWLAQFIFMLEHDISKIQPNELILLAFQDKTLFEMYDMILAAAQRLPWLRLTTQQDEKILTALRKRHHDDVLYGEIKYRDFFMKQNGTPSGKKSVSDWMNRMNDMIRRKSREEASSGQLGSKERRQENEASDG